MVKYRMEFTGTAVVEGKTDVEALSKVTDRLCALSGISYESIIITKEQ